MTRNYDIPGVHQLVLYVPAAATGDATADLSIIKVPDKCVISKVEIVPVSNVTGTDTNSRTYTLTNVTRSKNPASAQFLQTAGAGVLTSLTAGTASAMILSSTASDLNCNKGDILKLTSTKVGTGLAIPISAIIVTVTGA